MSDAFTAARPHLLALAYRLLGTWAEAEDVVQDAHLKWLERGPAPLDSELAWLRRVVTNQCLDLLERTRVRRNAYPGTWLPEPVPSAEVQVTPLDVEAVSLAFLTLLERLSPLERAVYVLAEAFGYGHEAIAQALGREPAAVRQLLHRARAHVAAGRPRFAPSRDAHESVLASFCGAVLQGDVAGLERLLVADAQARTDGGGKRRAALNVVTGANRVARFFVGVARKAPPTLRGELHDVNGWPSLVTFEGDTVTGLTQLETDGTHIFSVSVVTNPDKLAALSRRLAPG